MPLTLEYTRTRLPRGQKSEMPAARSTPTEADGSLIIKITPTYPAKQAIEQQRDLRQLVKALEHSLTGKPFSIEIIEAPSAHSENPTNPSPTAKEDPDHAVSEMPTFMTATNVMKLLGEKNRQTITNWKNKNIILSVPHTSGRPKYPSFQFISDLSGHYRIVDGMSSLLKIIEGWTAFRFLSTPYSELGGRLPIHLLREGQVDSVISLAAKIFDATSPDGFA